MFSSFICVYASPGFPRCLAGQRLLGLFTLGLRGLWFGLGQGMARLIFKLFAMGRSCGETQQEKSLG